MFRIIAIAVVCTMLLIPIAGFSSNIISNGPLLIVVSFGLAYVIIPAYLLHIWPVEPKQKPLSVETALWEGNLATTEYEVGDVAQIEETEDKGFHFLVATKGGKTLFLSGQYLYNLVDRKLFPSERVRVFRNRVTGMPYGIEPAGSPLKDWPAYEALSESQAAEEMVLLDGEVYEQSISAIVERLGLQRVATQVAQEARERDT